MHAIGMQDRIALIGFGEAASTFARAGGWGGSAIGFDIDPARMTAMIEQSLRPAATPAEALKEAALVLSLVTADAALATARDYAPHLTPGALWCDMNSVAPQTKRAAAEAVEAAGGRYVDAAILAPVEPARLAVPVLLSGDAAEAARGRLGAAGFTDVRIAGAEVGQASAIKLIRSVMVKGIEALTAEMMLAAEAAGVTEEVLTSLDASERARPWAGRAAYNLERMATHGERRAAEMEESVKMLVSLGVEPVMTRGTVRRQREAAGGGASSIGGNGERQ